MIVTTDSESIAEAAEAEGAEVPFLRPDSLSDDHTPTIPVIRHAVETMEQSGEAVEFACCIYATAPFVQSQDLAKGLALLNSHPNGEFAFPVTTFPFPIMRGLKIDGDQIEMIWPEHESTRSQDLVEAWHDAGQFYWGTGAAWKSAEGVYSANCLPIRIPRWRVQDIDTEEDWQVAERLFELAESDESES